MVPRILILLIVYRSVRVNKVFRRCLLEVQGFLFLDDLTEFPFREFDFILNCDSKRETLKVGDGEEVVMVGEHRGYLSTIIFTMAADKLIRKVCDAYLAYVHDKCLMGSAMEKIQTVRDFPDKLSGLPPDREVEFRIEVLLGTVSMSISHYRMPLEKLEELKFQLQKLLD
ncbi:alcohol-forming fatty acyl-CoA reductase-like [Gossypium australe]|uniref:Alcohol-forming fatty acyl-CoA reductase-like n=1 Tax=Gossypium australe TaxID=47621 RepID=A0A5B6VCH3_9ROSI|nr:alcohol-forming fatty acyl-CoA reductase-like [Gossypium australe]